MTWQSLACAERVRKPLLQRSQPLLVHGEVQFVDIKLRSAEQQIPANHLSGSRIKYEYLRRSSFDIGAWTKWPVESSGTAGRTFLLRRGLAKQIRTRRPALATFDRGHLEAFQSKIQPLSSCRVVRQNDCGELLASVRRSCVVRGVKCAPAWFCNKFSCNRWSWLGSSMLTLSSECSSRTSKSQCTEANAGQRPSRLSDLAVGRCPGPAPQNRRGGLRKSRI